MTFTDYTAEATAVIHERFGPDVEFPDSFESDLRRHFNRGLRALDAAVQVAKSYGWYDDQD